MYREASFWPGNKLYQQSDKTVLASIEHQPACQETSSLTYNQNQNTQGTLNAVKLKYIIFPHTESRIQQSNSGRMKAVLTPIPVSPGLLNLSKFSFISLISFLQAKKKSATHNTMSLIYA